MAKSLYSLPMPPQRFGISTVNVLVTIHIFFRQNWESFQKKQ